jgi:hypothetical protein
MGWDDLSSEMRESPRPTGARIGTGYREQGEARWRHWLARLWGLAAIKLSETEPALEAKLFALSERSIQLGTMIPEVDDLDMSDVAAIMEVDVPFAGYCCIALFEIGSHIKQIGSPATVRE